MTKQWYLILGSLLLVTFTAGFGIGWSVRGTDDVSQLTPSTVQANYVTVANGSDFTPPRGAANGPSEYGPWNKRLMIARSDDGLTFYRSNVIVTDQGDVPDLVVDNDGRIYLYYTGWTVGEQHNKTVVALSDDGGDTWQFHRVKLTGFSGWADPVDPDIQILSDGVFRLYHTTDPKDGAGPRTFYADSTDGINFLLKDAAFAVPGRPVLDPSSLVIGQTWHLFNGGAAPGVNWHATSSNGKTFTYLEKFEEKINGVGQLMANGLAVPGGYRFYSFDHILPESGSSSNIHSFFTTDGVKWEVESGTRLAATDSPLESRGVFDPAVARLPDGSYLMVYVTFIPNQ